MSIPCLTIAGECAPSLNIGSRATMAGGLDTETCKVAKYADHDISIFGWSSWVSFMMAALTCSSQTCCIWSSSKRLLAGINWPSVAGGVGLIFSGSKTGGTVVYDCGKDLTDFDFGGSVVWGIRTGDLVIPAFSFVKCCVIDKAVPWKDSCDDVDDGLWSTLSRSSVAPSLDCFFGLFLCRPYYGPSSVGTLLCVGRMKTFFEQLLVSCCFFCDLVWSYYSLNKKM